MVKGVTKRVIVIKSPDRRLFEEAIFFVREEALHNSGVTGDEILKQAREVADNYVRSNEKKSAFSRIPPIGFAGLGAAAAALVWAVTAFIF